MLQTSNHTHKHIFLNIYRPVYPFGSGKYIFICTFPVHSFSEQGEFTSNPYFVFIIVEAIKEPTEALV